MTNFAGHRFKPGDRAVIATHVPRCYYNGATVTVRSGLQPVRGRRGIAAGYFVDPDRRHPSDADAAFVVYWDEIEPIDEIGHDDPNQVVSWDDCVWRPDEDILDWMRLMKVVSATAGRLGFRPDVEPGEGKA